MAVQLHWADLYAWLTIFLEFGLKKKEDCHNFKCAIIEVDNEISSSNSHNFEIDNAAYQDDSP